MVGQHIRILKGGRWVHAVDCGDETVLHLVEEAPPPRVRRAYRPEFVAGAQAVEVVTHRERTFPAKEIVKRAYSRASDPALAAMFQDSESFVEWCTTGRLTAARNTALEVPGVAPAPAPARPAPGPNGKPSGAAKPPAKKAAAKVKAAARKPAAKKVPPKKVAAKKPAPRKAAPTAKRAKPKAKAPARKVAARKPAAKAKKPARKGRR
jgi:hypothetical protein